MLVSMWLPDALFRRLAANTPSDLAETLRLTFRFDRRVFLWALAVSTVACVAFGLGPALRCSRVDMGEVIKESHGASKRGLMPSILSYQAIVSMRALAIAGLMLRSTPVAEGMRIRRAVADLTAVRLEAREVVDPRQREQLTIAIAERLGSIAGSGKIAGMAGEMQPGVSQTLRVTADYFALLRLPWAAGRTFAQSDSAAGVMVINEAFADRFWPDRTAVGQVLSHDAVVWDKSLSGRQVIGIVRDGQQATPTAYVPAEPKDAAILLARADRHRLLRELPPFVATLPGSVNVEIVSGSEWIAGIVGPSVLAAWVTMAFGAVALGLGSMGFFSLLDYAVQQRTREMGIRQALGAEPHHIVRCLVEPAARPLLRGIVIGAVGTGLVGFAMRRADLPAGVNPLDVGVYASVAAVLIIAGLLASLGPARRVIRIEPSKALRVD
jgi:putative ABC transport system permease protein